MADVIDFRPKSNRKVCPYCGDEPHEGEFMCPRIARVSYHYSEDSTAVVVDLVHGELELIFEGGRDDEDSGDS